MPASSLVGRRRASPARRTGFSILGAVPASSTAARAARRAASVPPITYPPQLPVSARHDELLEAIRDHQVVIVAGETGSGKTTQLPKICLELGRGVEGTIAHTQPRRIAARTVAARIAEELGTPLGGVVGYAVRFERKATDETLVRLMTDGLLLAEIEHDRLLRRYDTIIVDEAHERSLNIDFLLGYLARILPQRPDLKLIITSATIDADRFGAHFGGAPVIEVSGRTYPVEVRYRPLGEDEDPSPDGDEDDEDAGRTRDRDQTEAIGDAIEELPRQGDVLVFLSGEREIRDTADYLAGRLGDRVDLLPLYARLSTAEQQRVFRRGPQETNRRVVLATNVAETSLTVPGIRYVVDTGTARISRYSSRLKVQRLPIEPISQASAKQRAGRCGRVADGIAIRLYSERDHDARPAYTDPEILRTSLAAVILQMAALGLGQVADFPFLDPPDARRVRDGVLLLEELGALVPRGRDERAPLQLTPLGRRLAQLPVDPRMGRMVLEADRLDALDEVIVIVAALSIQDPRVRPADLRAQADQQHARFKDEDSDFLAFLNLWRYLEDLQREVSRSAFRRRCRDEYLHFLRVREWQDLVARLRQATRQMKLRINATPAHRNHVHQALLAGLLSHVGMRDAARREYAGARGARFAVFPGSALSRRQPDWVMAAELVETSRLFAREVARIDPKWIEPLADHLVKRTYSEPRWDRRRGGAVATERVTLYGLPIVAGRTVPYGGVDPEVARQLFIQHALVQGEWDTHHAFVAANAAAVEQVERLEDRSRRRGLLVGDDVRYAFFASRIPLEVHSARHFDRWWKDARRTDPDRLTLTTEELIDPAARAALDPQAFPTGWKQGEHVLRLSYRFEPGAADDGITVHVPLDAVGQIRPREFEWLVPGLREELVTTLLRGLPKELRRPLVPIPESATAVLDGLRPRREPLHAAVRRELEARRGVRVPDGVLEAIALPDHLRVTFLVQDADGKIVAGGKDLDALRERARPKLADEIAAQTPALQRSGLKAWTIGTLPREVPVRDGAATAYPALVDEGATAGVRVFDSRDAQAQAMRAGTRRLLLLSAPSPVRWVKDQLDLWQQVTLADAPLGGTDAVLADAAGAAVDALVATGGGPAWDEASFARLRGHVAGSLAEETAAIVTVLVDLLARRGEVIERAARLESPAVAPLRADVLAQLGFLVHPGFLTAAGAARLGDIDRYLRAILHRLARLAQSDARHRELVQGLEAEIAAVRAGWPAGRPVPTALLELPWLVQELRVSLFAQSIGTRAPVSEKRIRAVLAQVTAQR
ncbi:ATP-dependent RNA helicase HrpA [Conexibacter sp. W3-3-2]|nr:ATP-dependent RNA helicase HrpA [Conexibacter sp. W3-3-2]